MPDACMCTQAQYPPPSVSALPPSKQKALARQSISCTHTSTPGDSGSGQKRRSEDGGSVAGCATAHADGAAMDTACSTTFTSPVAFAAAALARKASGGGTNGARSSLTTINPVALSESLATALQGMLSQVEPQGAAGNSGAAGSEKGTTISLPARAQKALVSCKGLLGSACCVEARGGHLNITVPGVTLQPPVVSAAVSATAKQETASTQSAPVADLGPAAKRPRQQAEHAATAGQTPNPEEAEGKQGVIQLTGPKPQQSSRQQGQHVSSESEQQAAATTGGEAGGCSSTHLGHRFEIVTVRSRFIQEEFELYKKWVIAVQKAGGCSAKSGCLQYSRALLGLYEKYMFCVVCCRAQNVCSRIVIRSLQGTSGNTVHPTILISCVMSVMLGCCPRCMCIMSPAHVIFYVLHAPAPDPFI